MPIRIQGRIQVSICSVALARLCQNARELRDLRNLKDDKQRFIFLFDRNWNFDEERVHAHWMIGESCELLMKVFGRFVDWYGDAISTQKGGPAALKRWKNLCRTWARVKPSDW